MIIYHIAEFVILTLLVIRIFYYLKFNKVILRENLEVLLYIFLVFLDNLVNLLFGNFPIFTTIFDSVLPCIIIIPIIFRKLSLSSNSLILTILLLCAFSLKINNLHFNYILYIVSISILILESINLGTGSSRNRKKTPLYIIIIIDLIAIVIVQQIQVLNIRWDNSIFAVKSDYIALTIYMTNLILTHVYIRRYFNN